MRAALQRKKHEATGAALDAKVAQLKGKATGGEEEKEYEEDIN